MNIQTDIKPIGEVERIIEYSDGSPKEVKYFRNTILKNGRIALAKSLANDIGGSYAFYISKMIFGTGGTSGGAERFVNADRNALFCGIPPANCIKPVIASTDVTQVIFTSVLTFEDAIGLILNEMALMMANEQLYSMVTFPDFTKTGAMQVTWNWRLNFV